MFVRSLFMDLLIVFVFVVVCPVVLASMCSSFLYDPFWGAQLLIHLVVFFMC